MQFHSFSVAALLAIGMLTPILTFAQNHQLSSPNFPAPGNVYIATFGDRAFRLEFHPNAKDMTFTRLDKSTETIQYSAVEIRPKVFMVFWKEPTSGNTVVHLEDFENEIVHTNITTPEGKFFNLKGTLKRAP